MSEEKRIKAKLWKKGKFTLKTDKGEVNILRLLCLLLVIRRRKHKSKRACTHACTRNYNFKCDWLI